MLGPMDDLPSPSAALDLLLAGNRRFVQGVPEHPNQDAARRAALAPVQHPFAVLFGCSDSRLLAADNLIFDRGWGDLFWSDSPATSSRGGPRQRRRGTDSVLQICPLIVRTGLHGTGRGAIAARATRPPPGDARRVRPGRRGTGHQQRHGRHANGHDQDEQILDEHITRTVGLLMERSRALADQVAAGRTAVVGLAYRLADGSARLVTTHGLPSAGSHHCVTASVWTPPGTGGLSGGACAERSSSRRTGHDRVCPAPSRPDGPQSPPEAGLLGGGPGRNGRPLLVCAGARHSRGDRWGTRRRLMFPFGGQRLCRWSRRDLLPLGLLLREMVMHHSRTGTTRPAVGACGAGGRP